MKILVTGGAGFIGSHVIDKLIEAGHEPRIFDLRTSPYHAPDEVEHELGDVTDREALARAVDGCEAIIHLAAVADVADVVANPDQAQRFNAQGTLAVLEAARDSDVGRVVYGSTIWVYSDCDSDSVDEDTPLPPPCHLYTATKLAGELYCRSYQELFGVDYTILRFGIPYGPRARDATVMAAFAGKAERGEPLTLNGDGNQMRRFVYVEDLAEGIVAGLRPAAANRVYNLAGEEEVTIRQIAEAVRDQVRDTGIEYTPPRPGDLGSKHVSSARAARELDWTAGTSFDEGFRRYLAWRRTREHPRRALIFSADIGEGHDLPARALAGQLRAESPGIQVDIVDGLRAMGRVATFVIRDGSWFSFNWFPWLYELQYVLLQRFAPARWLAMRVGALLSARRLLKTIRKHEPDVVASTYPGTTALLGALRRQGRLDVPVVSIITDLAGLRYWAHPGIDLHTVTHPESVEEVERIAGPGSARWAQPPTSPAFLEPRDRNEARRGLGLAEDGRVLVVSGGGWGIGDLAGAVEACLEVDGATVICLNGHSERASRRLQERFGANPRVRLLGFTDRMSDLLAAADVLVHSTAGLTVLEAQIRGCPVVSYGFAVGHIRASNRAYERFGLARVATSPSALRSDLAEALEDSPEPDGRFASLVSPADLVLAAKPRVRPLPAVRLRAVRVATATALTGLVVSGVMLTDYVYPVFAKLLHTSPTTSVETSQPEVALLVNSQPQEVAGVARQLARHGATASFAVAEAPGDATLAALRRRGDEAMPRLDSGGMFHSLGTKGRLSRAAAALGLGKDFMYEPDTDFTLAQDWLAHAAGGSAVRGAVKLDVGSPVDELHAGEIVQVDLNGDRADWHSTLASLDQSLARDGLSAVSVTQLTDTAQP